MSNLLLQSLDELIHFIEIWETKQRNPILCIGSWNVHRWKDGKNKQNEERVMEYMKTKRMDIFATQESNTKYKEKFSEINELKYSSMRRCRNGCGVVLFSKYEIIKTIRNDSKHKMQLDLIQLTDIFNNIVIGVINVHFNYLNEKRRISEYVEMLKMIEEYKQYPLILLGDFNAFNRNDYVINEWSSICQIFDCNNWGKPQCKLLSMINEANYFHDCLYLLRRSLNHEKHKETVVTDPNNDNIDDEFKSKYNKKKKKIKRKDCSQNTMKGELWKNVLSGKLGTCRFDTRIDYIFVNDHLLELFKITRYEHCDSLCSDHKLIQIDLIFKQ